MAWFTNGLITNPIDGQLLVDTGALAAGTIGGSLLCYSTLPCLLTLHRHNSTNTADITTQKVALGCFANNFTVHSIPTGIILALNERVTVTIDTGFIGSIQVSLVG